MSLYHFEPTNHGLRFGNFEIIWAQNSKDFFFSNTFLFHGKNGLIIDPSANFTYIQKIAAHREVKRVLNSHYHTDHRALNSFFPHAHFMAHHADAPAISSSAKYQAWIDRDPDSPYSQWVQDFSRTMNIPDNYIDQPLKDGDIIQTDGFELKVIHTPGHTPGHIAIQVMPINILITFDIDLTPYGPWYANEVSDIDAFIQSIEKIKSVKAAAYITSHGERFYDPETFRKKIERFERYFEDRDNKILETLKEKPASLEDLNETGIIYKKRILEDRLKFYFGLKMLEKHLERLIKKGVVTKDNGLYCLV
jgi:endoribonuclease LACTB2